jgi:hypothetical protein
MVIVVVMDISSHFYNKNRTLIGKPEAIVTRDWSLCREQRKAAPKESIITLVLFFALMTNLGDRSND